jgi:exopolysaccharide biosynthesis predicted pyruvyltransferase EpsI
MARDKVSYETAKDMLTSAEVLIYPDIVTSLIGKYSFNDKRNCETKKYSGGNEKQVFIHSV